jgi:mannitol 2-dehydrogenase
MSSPTTLQNSKLSQLGSEIPVPKYDRKKLPANILHFGIGGFHRSHQAAYLNDLLNKHSNQAPAWGIHGIGVLEADRKMRDALAAQDFLYTVVTRDAKEDKATIIGSIGGMSLTVDNPEAVFEKLTSSDLKIIALSITEKGYYHDPATGKLNTKEASIAHDLEHPDKPKTAIGCIVEGLNRRMKKGAKPITLQSCDNLMGNGETLKDCLMAFASMRDDKLAHWIEHELTFPNSMVDRITPVTTEDHRTMIREKFEIEDRWPIVCESFRQWVIEDKFCQGRPAWEEVGAQIVPDVLPYERMKVRLLNGGHSALAYLSYLMGHREVASATQDPLVNQFLRQLMDKEITPTLDPVPGIDLKAYKNSLIERFSNPNVGDQIQRLAMDGSSKLVNNLIPCVRDQLKKNGSVRLLALSLAGWMRYLKAMDEQRKPIEITDPIAERLVSLANKEPHHPSHLLSIREMFGEDLPQSKVFIDELAKALDSLYKDGAKATLTSYLA